MIKTGDARIVNISWITPQFIFLFNPRTLLKPFSCKQAYLNSYLCLIFLTRELAKKLDGTSVTTYSAHPGFVKKTFFRFLPKTIQLIFKAVIYWFSKV